MFSLLIAKQPRTWMEPAGVRFLFEVDGNSSDPFQASHLLLALAAYLSRDSIVLAVLTQASLSQCKAIRGSISFSSPEAAEGEEDVSK